MAGGGQLGGGILATGLCSWRRARLGDAHGCLPDEATPLGEIALVQHAAHRHRDEVAVGHVLVAVGEGEPRRLAVKVDCLARGGQPAVRPGHGFERCHVPALQHAEDLAEGQGAGGGGREAAHLALAIVKAEAVPQPGAVAGQIRGAQHPGVGGMGVHLGHHGLGDGPSIEGIGTVPCQRPEYPGQCRVGEAGARHLGAAVRLVEVGPGLGVFGQIGVLGEQGGQAWAYHKALLCQGDGGLEQAGPGQLAIALVGQGQGAHRAGGTDRATAHHAVVERHRFAILHEQLIRGRRGGRLTAIHGRHLLAIPHQHEGAAADPGGLRLHQGQYQLDGDGRIDGAASRLDDLVARIHRQRVGRGHHEVAPLPARLVGPAAGRLRGDQCLGRGDIMKGTLGGAAGEQAEGDQQGEGFEGHDRLLVGFLYTRRNVAQLEPN
ncbi:hypothetical protein D3C76_359240 [compost metagenome]